MRLAKSGAGSAAIDVLKGTGVAAGLSVGAVLLLALGLKALPISDTAIPIINQVIKIASVGAGTLMAVGRGGERGLPKGAAVGAAYMLLGTLVYYLLGGGAATPVAALADVGLGTAAGAVCGILSANMPAPAARKSARA